MNVGVVAGLAGLAGGGAGVRNVRSLNLFSSACMAGAVSGSETILQDISFSVAPGESLALLGRNGAGKSTLLKILTRATPATSGSVVNNGRTTALIELGLGMNPELTGRENALMGCQIQDLNDPLEQLVE